VLTADLAEREALASVERRVADASQPIDLLVNNAGFALGSGFLASTADDEEKLVDVHVRAVLRLSKAAVDVMVTRGHGWIINVASVAAFAPYGTYGAAKAWATSFSEGLDGELAGTGVRAVACCPGYVRTEFHQRAGMSVGKLPEIAWLQADDVVKETLRRMERGSPVIVPTLRYRLVAGLARHAPRGIVGAVARRMRTGR
jgi:short-subunit dehydrogenase